MFCEVSSPPLDLIGPYDEKDDDGDQVMEETSSVYNDDKIMEEEAYSKKRQLSLRSHPSKRGRHEFQSKLKPEKGEVEAHLVDSPYFKGTTLFKHVPYEDIEIEDEVKAAIKTLEENSSEYESFDELCGHGLLDHVKISGFDKGKIAIRTYPVLQVISVVLYNNKSDPPSFKVYGEISVTDYNKNTFFIWKRKPEEPDCVSCKRDYLVLDDCPIPPVLGGKVKFRLINDEAIEMFNKEYDLDNTSEDVRDEETMNQMVTREFLGEDGYCARMVFARIPVSALVRVQVSVYYKPPNCGVGTVCKVSGRITANNAVCWESSEFGDMRYGENVVFNRRMVALPLFSPLVMEFSLNFDDGGRAYKKYEISPLFWKSSLDRSAEIPSESGDCFFGLELKFVQHYDFFDESKRFSNFLNMAWGPDIPSKVQIDQPLTEVKSGQALVEIFSVYFGGTIVVLDGDGRVYIFSRNKKRPDKLSWSNKQQSFIRSVSLAWPDRWILEKDFYMYLKLKNVENHQVCRGNLRLQSNRYGYCDYDDSRYGKRFCDVIQGEKGLFAAVHYSIFINGKKIRVTMFCSKEGGLNNGLLVYGSVFAAYGNYNYPSTYDKECYRVIIFKRSEEDYLRVNSSSELPLSKSHISAPSDCEKLIIDADLWVSPYMTCSTYQRETANFEFESSRNGSQSKGCITVNVDWIQ